MPALDNGPQNSAPSALVHSAGPSTRRSPDSKCLVLRLEPALASSRCSFQARRVLPPPVKINHNDGGSQSWTSAKTRSTWLNYCRRIVQQRVTLAAPVPVSGEPRVTEMGSEASSCTSRLQKYPSPSRSLRGGCPCHPAHSCIGSGSDPSCVDSRISPQRSGARSWQNAWTAPDNRYKTGRTCGAESYLKRCTTAQLTYPFFPSTHAVARASCVASL